MIYLQKILSGLKECLESGWCARCVYHKSSAVLCCRELLNDIYTLLNEQNEQKCINCKHRPINAGPGKHLEAPAIEYADLGGEEPEPIDWDYTCPYVCGDSWYNRMPKDDDFCSKFDKKEEER